MQHKNSKLAARKKEKKKKKNLRLGCLGVGEKVAGFEFANLSHMSDHHTHMSHHHHRL